MIQNIGIYKTPGYSLIMATRSVLSLSGHMGRTNTVIVLHMAGAKKNVVYFPGDTQVRSASRDRIYSRVSIYNMVYVKMIKYSTNQLL